MALSPTVPLKLVALKCTTRLLKELEEQGIIRKTRRYLEVLDMEKLAEMASYPLDMALDAGSRNPLHIQATAKAQAGPHGQQKTEA